MKRKILLINPRFQLTFLAYTVGLSAIAIAIFWSANAYFFYKFNRMGIDLGLPTNHVFFSFLNEQRYVMNWVFALTAIVAFAALCLGGLIISHRVAGPLYRLRTHLTKIADGSPLTEVKFREKDFFPELADAFNAHARRYKSENAAGMTEEKKAS